MASCKIGHVYIVKTSLTDPPKAKFALCVCVEEGYFVWINSDARRHGKDQLPLKQGCHPLIRHDSVLDLSRVVAHPSHELEEAREFPAISKSLCTEIVGKIDRGLSVMPRRQAKVIADNLRTLL
ncbi:hypothetical protein LCM4573_00015 [Rhizobium sp. LCM 4573]|nr:hypothetical protein LCM4573_00015 [Rhizobium sp. LCM 4573]